MSDTPVKVRSEQGIKIYSAPLPCASNRREAEKAVVRLLVQAAYGPEAVYDHTESGAPVVRLGSQLCRSISVSHCHDEAALAVAEEGDFIGVDIEEARNQLFKVAPRVLSVEELGYYGNDITGLLEAWTLKEAAYKAHGVKGIDFRTDILLPVPGLQETLTVQGIQYDIILLEHNHSHCLAIVFRRTD